MKIIDLKNYPGALAMVKKEAAIHCWMKHSSIIRYFGHRQCKDYYYIFLEYASGGELFDRIGSLIYFSYVFINYDTY